MNRHDEIQAAARDIASNVHADPITRNQMADDLIRLIGLMVSGVGKYVAVQGEAEMNDTAGWVFEPDPEEAPEETAERQSEFEREQMSTADKFHGMYLTGERIQDAARELMDDCQGADLERYHRPTGCGRCSVTQRCDEPVAGCYVHPPQGDGAPVDVAAFLRELGDLCTRFGVYLGADFEDPNLTVFQDGVTRKLATGVLAEDREGGGTYYSYYLTDQDEGGN